MSKTRTLKIAAGIAGSIAGLLGTIIFLSQAKIISFPMAMLMVVALVGLTVGFGILIVIYRLTGKLD